MKRSLLLLTVLFCCAVSRSALAQPNTLTIGQSEQVFVLDSQNTDARGVACHNDSPGRSQLFVLDRQRKIFAYRLPASGGATDQLERIETYELSGVAGLSDLADLRGLASGIERGHPVFYFLDWGRAAGQARSRLWRYNVDASRAACVDLTQYRFQIGDREPLDVAWDAGRIWISFDASGYTDPNLRLQRGILALRWEGEFDESPLSVRHLPDAGTLPCRGLTSMELDGSGYLWATAGDEHIYCAEAATGRGLFYFQRPAPGTGMAYADGALWVAAGVPGPDRLHRVNVTKNPDAFFAGPRVLRRLVMTIQTVPETESPHAGVVDHYFSRPCASKLLLRQGSWPETETLLDVSEADNATLLTLTHDPASDSSSRQTLRCVEYADAPSRPYASRYEIDMWTSPYRKFVYPHRVDMDRQELGAADYLADDPDLYGLSDVETYTKFVERVKTHIERKYGAAANMGNPYWAARNIVEYIQDSYYYPNREKRMPATVDYGRQHYDANPANLKIELSDRPYDKGQIIACSGTSVMVAGAMRYLGFPARWLGTGTPAKSSDWDANANGLMDGDEMATCSNGHRYSQVWLGSHYGWICFDATPSKPPLNDYDPPPPLQSQWRYMTRAAGGHREENRIVFNIGSELIRPLYRDFEFDERLAIDNNCGGDQRYNLLGRFEKPELWQQPRHGIKVKNPCSIQLVKVSNASPHSQLTWQLDGPWQSLPDATLSIYLQQLDNDGKSAVDVTCVAERVAADARSATMDLSSHHGQRFRLILRRDGDPLTGGVSPPFDL